MLYNGVKQLIAANLDRQAKDEIAPAFPATAGDPNPTAQAQLCEQLLKAIRLVWDDHRTCMSKIKAVLTYMVRTIPALFSASLTTTTGPSIYRECWSPTDVRCGIEDILGPNRAFRAVSYSASPSQLLAHTNTH